MAEKPKQPAIPAVPNDVSPSMRNFMTAIREVLQVQAGQGRGSELDKAVTFRDLGLTTGMGSSTAMMGRVLNNLVQNGELVTQQAVERPTTPTGVSVSAFVGGIAISWDNPRYSGHAYTEVFAQPTPVNAQEQPIDPPELNTETMLLGTAASPLLGVQARTLLGYYIWVRHVNRLGQVGPVHNATGTFLYLPPNPSVLLEQLTNQIRADQLTAELMTPINKVPTLEGAVQTNATAINNLNGTYTAQWSAKTQVGDLVGGFGTFNDGTTTRFTVHANRFAIMDSSLGNQSFVPFVVDNGKTVISDAFIRNAYIEQLAAGQITAAKINSLTLDAINITGGTLSLGSGNNMSYQEGGAAGFGKGGPYGGWGSGWHTIIYNDGGIYTDRIYASGGTFNNVTIAENCDVRGTVYANKIVGDVVAFRSYPSVDGGVFTYTDQTITPISFVLNSAPFERKMALVGASASITGSPSGGGGWIRLFVNGAVVCGNTINVMSRNLSGVYTIPANTQVSVSVQVSLHSWYSSCHAIAAIEMVAVYKESGGTFA